MMTAGSGGRRGAPREERRERWSKMRARDPQEPSRGATPLELLFDLCFVVAVAQAAGRLSHALAAGRGGDAVLSYALVFFAIWWAWMNFTWFASAYDTDDVPYRLLTLLQIAGVLVLAAGVPAAFDDRNFATVTVGYVLMRVAMVTQWLRVAHDEPGHRSVALRYAAGISACQVGWLALLAVPPPWGLFGFALLAALELAVPIWAEHADQATTWHPEHIAERYGLFTLIVLGEAILAATIAVQAAITASGLPSLLLVAGGGLVLIFSLWWTYFDRPATEGLRAAHPSAFRWGYGHVLVFASLAAVGSGLQVVARTVSHTSALSSRAAAFTLAAPVAVYLVTIGLLHTSINRHRGDRVAARFGVTAGLVVLAAAATPPIPLALTVPLVGLLVAGVLTLDLLLAPGRGSRGTD